MIDYEKFLQENVLPELEKGRPNWDKPHTESVVKYIKAIIENSPDLNLDRDVLIIAAYLHDWGYSGLFSGGKPVQLKEVMDVKLAHMDIGANKTKELLNQPVFTFLSPEQKDRVTHLVLVHDKLSQLSELDELVLMEADTLGGLDVSNVTPTFNYESNQKYIQGVKNKRYPRFITSCGKKEYNRLVKLREEFYRSC